MVIHVIDNMYTQVHMMKLLTAFTSQYEDCRAAVAKGYSHGPHRNYIFFVNRQASEESAVGNICIDNRSSSSSS